MQQSLSIDCVVAVSMGGVIGAGYAVGMSPQMMETEALRMSSLSNLVKLVDHRFPDGGLVEGERIRSYIGGLIGEETAFSDLKVPLALVAVDINQGEEIVLQQGNVVDAVRATVAIPGLIAPMEMNGYRLVDGGLLNNLPVDVARQMGADVVIAVDMSDDFQNGQNSLTNNRFVPNGLKRTMDDTYRSLSIARSKLYEYKIAQTPPDIWIKPLAGSNLNFLTGYTRAAETIAAGEAATTAVLPQIRQAISAERPPAVDLPL